MDIDKYYASIQPNPFEAIDPFLDRWVEQDQNVKLIRMARGYPMRRVVILPFHQYFIDIGRPNNLGQVTLLIVRDIPSRVVSEIREKRIQCEDVNDLGFYLDQAYAEIVKGF